MEKVDPKVYGLPPRTILMSNGNDDKNNPTIPPIESDPNLTEYCCPFCNRFLFRGNIQKLKMSCPHCQKMIDSDNDGLVKPMKDTTE